MKEVRNFQKVRVLDLMGFKVIDLLKIFLANFILENLKLKDWKRINRTRLLN